MGSASCPAAGVVTPPRGRPFPRRRRAAGPSARTRRLRRRRGRRAARARDQRAGAGPGRRPLPVRGPVRVPKLGLVKGPWTPGEDEVVRRAVAAAAAAPRRPELGGGRGALPGAPRQVREHQPAWKSTTRTHSVLISAQALAEPPGPVSGEDAPTAFQTLLLGRSRRSPAPRRDPRPRPVRERHQELLAPARRRFLNDAKPRARANCGGGGGRNARAAAAVIFVPVPPWLDPSEREAATIPASSARAPRRRRSLSLER